jgi:thiamine-phosphate pyrophosphorylase
MAKLYAIVGTIERARFMLEGGVPYLQLRFKDHPLSAHRQELLEWRDRFPRTRIIVNDDLDEAIAARAWGLHLGQEDLARYTQERLRALSEEGGPVLGVSTHNDAEIARAKSVGAAMLGFGPLFATNTKTLKHAPQGVAQLTAAVKAVDLPLVAIGGIGETTLDAVADTGVAMIAMIAYLDGISTQSGLEALQRRIAR